MTIAEQIIAYIETQLAKIRLGQQITLHGGGSYTFRTDAGRLVDRNLEYTEHPDDMPSTVLYPGGNTSSVDTDPEPELGMENHTLEISVEGFIESDKAGTEGEWLKADISCALKADLFWGGLIERLVTFNAESAVQVGDKVFTIVKVGLTALYTAPYGSE